MDRDRQTARQFGFDAVEEAIMSMSLKELLVRVSERDKQTVRPGVLTKVNGCVKFRI